MPLSYYPRPWRKRGTTLRRIENGKITKKGRKFQPLILFSDMESAGGGVTMDKVKIRKLKEQMSERLEENCQIWMSMRNALSPLEDDEPSPIISIGSAFTPPARLVDSPSPDPYHERCSRHLSFYSEDKSSSVERKSMHRSLKGKEKRKNLPKTATETLRRWLSEHITHPYPTDEEKQKMATDLGLSQVQISNWFINGRRRYLQGMRDKMEATMADATLPDNSYNFVYS